MLVVGGYNGGAIVGSAEMYDLESPNTTCSNFPGVPVGGFEGLNGGKLLTFAADEKKIKVKYLFEKPLYLLDKVFITAMAYCRRGQHTPRSHVRPAKSKFLAL